MSPPPDPTRSRMVPAESVEVLVARLEERLSTMRQFQERNEREVDEIRTTISALTELDRRLTEQLNAQQSAIGAVREEARRAAREAAREGLREAVAGIVREEITAYVTGPRSGDDPELARVRIASRKEIWLAIIAALGSLGVAITSIVMQGGAP